VTGFTGVTPVWVVARADGQKVYVLTQGDGQLVTIDTGHGHGYQQSSRRHWSETLFSSIRI